MSALIDVKELSRTEIINTIALCGIVNSGIDRKTVAESLELFQGKAIIAALDNSDTAGAYLAVLESDPDKIMEGINAAALGAGAEEKFLYLPEYAQSLAEALEAPADTYGITIRTGLVSKYEEKESLILHLITMADISECFCGTYKDGIYVSVNNGSIVKLSADLKISELIGDTTQGLKGLQLGYRFHGKEALEYTLREAEVTNGVVRTLDNILCVIEETEKILTAYRAQSCGKCVFCREGLIQLQGMHKDITEGRGKMEYIALINEIGKAMTFSSNCSLGDKASEIALSAVEYFLGEYDSHIKKKKCEAGVCQAFSKLYIDPVLCTGCGDCMDVCPVNCIEGKMGYIHMIDEFDCTKCGKCMKACEDGAVRLTDGKLPKLPERLTKCGKFKK